MQDHLSCTCGGSNENCSRCFGAGFIVRPGFSGVAQLNASRTESLLSSPVSMRSGTKLPGLPQSTIADRQRKGVRMQSAEGSARTQTIDYMDANRGMGFFARENGRYGSHPLHDRFDDESGPDARSIEQFW
jgi:hypothetical protein